MRLSTSAAVACMVMTLGCYHATVETGLTPSGQTISKPWAASFVYGLVPPSTVETMAKCPNGVAKVETQLSFLNQIVNILTLGIFTPMTIDVQCAAPRTSSLPNDLGPIGVDLNSSLEQKQQAVARAADLAAKTHSAVYVVFE